MDRLQTTLPHATKLNTTDYLAYAILPLLAFSLIAKTVVGFFWLALLILGVAYRIRQGWQPPKAETETLRDPTNKIVFGWLLVCLIGFGLKAIPTTYWAGRWDERHAELRLLLGAAGILLLWRHQMLPKNWEIWTGHALALACLSAFFLAATVGSNLAPTNRIPWTAGVALFSLVLLSWSFGETRFSLWWRLASLLALDAIFISGVRGSYWAIVVWPTAFLFLSRNSHAVSSRGTAILASVVLAIFFGLTAWLPSAESPFIRIKQVLSEMAPRERLAEFDVNSSYGARILLWETGIEAIKENALIGVGPIMGKILIKKAAENNHSETVANLTHYHNDYINTAVEFGSFGLLAFLSYCIGLGWCAFRLFRISEERAAIGIVSVLITHMLTSMSNVNFAHNFYPTALSVAVSLLLIQPRLKREPPKETRISKNNYDGGLFRQRL